MKSRMPDPAQISDHNGFVSGHRFSDAVDPLANAAALAAGGAAAERIYAPNNNSPSLTTCNSIHPSSGNESTGKRFCHKLNRNRILLVGVLDAAPAFFSPSDPEVGIANNHVNGTLNSKFRSSAIAACSSFWLDDANTLPATPFSIFQVVSFPAFAPASIRNVRLGRGSPLAHDSMLTTISKSSAGAFAEKSSRPYKQVASIPA